MFREGDHIWERASEGEGQEWDEERQRASASASRGEPWSTGS